jgi:hypothetical protein
VGISIAKVGYVKDNTLRKQQHYSKTKQKKKKVGTKFK